MFQASAAHYSGALGLFLCLGFVNVNAQQPDFTGVWTNYVEPGGRAGGAAANTTTSPCRPVRLSRLARLV